MGEMGFEAAIWIGRKGVQSTPYMAVAGEMVCIAHPTVLAACCGRNGVRCTPYMVAGAVILELPFASTRRLPLSRLLRRPLLLGTFGGS